MGFEIEKEAVVVVITHSLPYKPEVRTEYSKQVFQKFKDYVLESNVVHVNVAMPDLLRKEFFAVYMDAATGEMERFKQHLFQEFTKQYNIRHWFDREAGLDDRIDEVFGAKKRPAAPSEGGGKAKRQRSR